MIPQPLTLPEILDSPLSDDEVVERVREGEVALFEILMRRYNERLFRVTRSIVGDAREAEDVMQDSYFRAFANLGQFRGDAQFATWLTKIGVYEALARVRRRDRFVGFEDLGEGAQPELSDFIRGVSSPEDETSNGELRRVLTWAIDALPESHRVVFVLRQVEGLSTAETASCLDISPESVRIRLHRARSRLRQLIDERIGSETRELYAFHLRRCDRVVAGAFEKIGALQAQHP